MKYVSFLFALFIATISFSQSLPKKYQKAVETKLNDSLSIVDYKGKKGLYSYTKNGFIFAPSDRYLHYFKVSNTVIEVVGNQLTAYNLFDHNEPTKLAQRNDQLKLYLVEENFIKYESTFWNLLDSCKIDSNHVWQSSQKSMFGLSLRGDYVIVYDVKYASPPGTTPLLDEYGDPIIYVSEEGYESYVYEASTNGYQSSGVFDRVKKEWFVEPKYMWIIPSFNGFTYYEELYDEYDQLKDWSFGYKSFDPASSFDNIREEAFFANMDYAKRVVPFYDVDSVEECTGVQLGSLYAGLRHDMFYYLDGKKGSFKYLEDVIEHEHVDYLNYFGNTRSYSVEINNGSGQIVQRQDSIRFDFDTTQRMSFHTLWASSNSLRHFLRITSDKSDIIYWYYPTTDSLHIEPYEGSSLKGNHARYGNHNAYSYVLEKLNDSLVYIENYQDVIYSTIPRIIEDPNSPNFGENIVETDPETGMMTFLYDKRQDHMDRSGVLNIASGKWIVPQKYQTIKLESDIFICGRREVDDSEIWWEDRYTLDGALIEQKRQ